MSAHNAGQDARPTEEEVLDLLYEALPDDAPANFYGVRPNLPRAEFYVEVQGECWRVFAERHLHNACAKCGDCFHPVVGPNTDGEPCEWRQDCGCHADEHTRMTRVFPPAPCRLCGGTGRDPLDPDDPCPGCFIPPAEGDEGVSR